MAKCFITGKSCMHLPVAIRLVVELPSGAVSVNSRSNKVTIKRPILEIGRF